MSAIIDSLASLYPAYHWPAAYQIENFTNRTYNCILYEFKDEGFSAFSADARGLNGEGPTYEEALEDLKLAIECRIEEGKGGIYLNTSDIAFQNIEFKSLEEEWILDGVVVLRKTNSSITIFKRT